MKGILLLAIVALFSFGASAQTSLEFSQVLQINSTTPVTCPAGKVWKVMGHFIPRLYDSNNTARNNCVSTGYMRPFWVNNEYFYSHQMAYGGADRFWVANQHFPFWLPEGSTLHVTCSIDFLSVIEFNVVP